MLRKGTTAGALATIVVAAALAVTGAQTAGAQATSTQAAGARTTGPSPHSWYSFAPYADETSYPAPDLTAIRSAAGVKDVTLAFVTAEGNTQCVPTWGGYSSYPAYGAAAYQRAEIKAFQRAGGSIVISFGGESGTELATACKTVGSLESAYEKVISAYGTNHIDFDIEGSDNANFQAAKRRAAALAALQTAAARHGRQLSVGLTLPALPTGLTPDDRRIIEDTAGAGVAISLVNGMAMDFGDSAAPDPASKMGAYAIDVAKGLRRQLHDVWPSLRASALSSLIGVTPMIGINDTRDEVFTLANASQLVDYAKQQKLGMLSMWELGRDKQCAHPVTSAQTGCSGVSQRPWAFAKLLRR